MKAGRNLLREQTERFSILYIFFPIWIQFTTGDVHRTVLNLGPSKTYFSQEYKSFDILSTFIIRFGQNSDIRNLHATLSFVCESHEDRRRKDVTFTVAVNNIRYREACAYIFYENLQVKNALVKSAN